MVKVKNRCKSSAEQFFDFIIDSALDDYNEFSENSISKSDFGVDVEYNRVQKGIKVLFKVLNYNFEQKEYGYKVITSQKELFVDMKITQLDEGCEVEYSSYSYATSSIVNFNDKAMEFIFGRSLRKSITTMINAIDNEIQKGVNV